MRQLSKALELLAHHPNEVSSGRVSGLIKGGIGLMGKWDLEAVERAFADAAINPANWNEAMNTVSRIRPRDRG